MIIKGKANIFKKLDMVEYLKKDVTKIIPPKKKCKKAKWWSVEALQIAEERREAKSKVKGNI